MSPKLYKNTSAITFPFFLLSPSRLAAARTVAVKTGSWELFPYLPKS